MTTPVDEFADMATEWAHEWFRKAPRAHGRLGELLRALTLRALTIERSGRLKLVLDPATGRHDPAATRSVGTETLFDF